MQLSRSKFRKSFILSTKKWIKCFAGKNPVNLRGKSGDITENRSDLEKSGRLLEKRTLIIPTTKETPWPRGGPGCSSRARAWRASQSIEDRLHHEICRTVSDGVCRPGLLPHKLPRTGRQAKSGSQRSTRNSSLCWQFGEIPAQEPFQLVPPKVYQVSVAIYRSALTGIR